MGHTMQCCLLVTVLLLLQQAAWASTYHQQIRQSEDVTEESADSSTVSVRVDGVVPRHLCRRALRNLEVSTDTKTLASSHRPNLWPLLRDLNFGLFS